MTERVRPELDPLGFKAGSFKITPSVGIQETYTDNLFASQNNERDDLITAVVPTMQIVSDWNRHSLSIAGQGTISRHASNTAEDHETYKIEANSRVDLSHDVHGLAKIGYEKGSEDRGSVDEAGGRTPTEFDVVTLDAGLSGTWNRLSLNMDGAFRRRDFDDVPTNGAAINNDDRDRDEHKLIVRAGYEIQPEYEAFAQTILTLVDYDSSADDNGFDRDNQGYEFRMGARVDLTGLIFADVFVGYLSRTYEGVGLSDVDTLAVGADVTWNITELTTIKGGFGRDVAETTLATASGSLDTSIRASIDHELLRNLILSSRLGLSRSEYEGTTREDDQFTAGFRALYRLNRNFSVFLDYEYSNRESSVPGADYDVNTISLRLMASL